MKIFLSSLCLLILSLNAFSQATVVPIVEMKVRGVLGGVLNGKFIDAKTTVEKIKGNENYTLFGIEGVNEGELSFGKPKNDQDVCTDFYYVEASEEAVAGVALGDGLGDGRDFRFRGVTTPESPQAESVKRMMVLPVLANRDRCFIILYLSIGANILGS